MLKLMPDNDETTVTKALKAALIGIETLKGNSFNLLPLIDFQHIRGTEPNILTMPAKNHLILFFVFPSGGG